MREKSIAQAAAVFLQNAGGSIELLRLMKLMYLADRESMSQCGLPISHDHMVSMDHGPVLSGALNLANRTGYSDFGAYWAEWVAPREGNVLRSARAFEREDLDYLSEFDLEVIQMVWDSFGHMTPSQIRNYTHDLPEWTDPSGSSLPIATLEVLSALGFDQEEAAELATEIQAQHELDQVFALA